MPEIILWLPRTGLCGLGARIQGITTVSVLANLLQSKLLVWSPPNTPCPYNLGDLISHPDFIAFSSSPPSEHLTVSPKLVLYLPLNAGKIEAYNMLRSLTGSPPSFSDFLDLCQRAICNLRPTSLNAHRIDSFVEAHLHESKAIGVHIRRTDILKSGVRGITRSNVKDFDLALFDRLKSEHDQYPDTVFYIATDHELYLNEWLSRLNSIGANALAFPKTWRGSHFRSTDGPAVIADLFCLSKCRHIICSCDSSIPSLAASIGKIQISKILPHK